MEAGAAIAFETDRHRFDVGARAYWASGEDRDNGQPLNSVGPPQATMALGWSTVDSGWQLKLQSTFTAAWSERDESGGELFETPAYSVFDLFLAHRIGDRLTLRAGVLNLTDRSYWSWTDVRGIAPDDPVLPHLSRPGRSFSLGVDMNW